MKLITFGLVLCFFYHRKVFGISELLFSEVEVESYNKAELLCESSNGLIANISNATELPQELKTLVNQKYKVSGTSKCFKFFRFMKQNINVWSFIIVNICNSLELDIRNSTACPHLGNLTQIVRSYSSLYCLLLVRVAVEAV